MAEPSRSGWHGQPPHLRVCSGCGKKLTLNEPGGLFFNDFRRVEGWPTVFHGGCWRKAK